MSVFRSAPVALALWILPQIPFAPPVLAQEACALERFPDISITFIRERPAVPVGINGRYVFFMLDTGFSKTAVTPETQSRFQLPTDARWHDKAIGTGGEITMPFATIKRFEISGQTYLNQSFPVVGLDQHLDDKTGQPDLYSGAIGGDFLRNYEVELDFPSKLMRLYRRPDCYEARPAWTTPYKTVAVRVTPTNTILLTVQLAGNPLKAVFDSGASRLVLALPALRSAGIDPASLQNDKTARMSGAGGLPSTAWIHPTHGLEIGGERFDTVDLFVQDFNLRIADMLIGEPYIRSHRIWISYKSNRMFVQAPAAK